MSSASPPDRPESAPVRVLPARPPDYALTPLPRPLTSLIDREPELAAVRALLLDEGVRLVTLTGPGGTGKTRVAIAAAGAAVTAFPDGLAFVSLAQLTDPDLVGVTIAVSLGLRDLGAEPPEGRLAGFLGDKRVLLVLDNFERVVAAAPLVADLLGDCPGLKALVTSRVRLRLSGERDLPVPALPLPLPASTERAVEDDRALSASVRLFAERARAVQPAFAVTAETAETVAAICRQVDGLPLAIELAAARVKSLPPAALLERLERRLPLLTGGPRDLPLRQQTMWDTIAWSHDLLSPEERILFRWLAVFIDGFTLEAAEAIGVQQSDGEGGGETSALSVLDGVASLVEQSLLRPATDPLAEPRYRMQETVREFGLEQLAASGEADEIGRRHAAFFLALAEAAESELFGPKQVGWLDRLEVERPNLRAALAWATTHDPELALRLGGALPQFWRLRGHLGEGREALERALAVGAGTPAARAKALLAAALVRLAQGDYAAAAALADDARGRFEALGDRRGLAAALRVIGYGHIGQEEEAPDPARFARCRAAFEEQLALCEALGDRHGVAMAIYGLGFLALHEGDDTRAAERLAEALPRFEAVGDRRGIYLVVTDLGWVAARQGDDAGAAVLFGRALGVAWDLGDKWATANVLGDVAWLAVRVGRAEAATRLLGAAAALRAADGIQLLLLHRSVHEAAAAAARAELGDAGFEAAWAAGRALSVEAAVNEAIELAAAPALPSAPEAATGPLAYGLTPREREVLCLLATGRTYREIAGQLFISFTTVRTHAQHVYAKLGCHSRHEAATLARERGLC